MIAYNIAFVIMYNYWHYLVGVIYILGSLQFVSI